MSHYFYAYCVVFYFHDFDSFKWFNKEDLCLFLLVKLHL